MKILDKLSGMKRDETVEHRVNPVYDTARSCLVNLVQTGLDEACLLNEELKFTDDSKPGNMIARGVSVFQEIRYRFVNHYAAESGYMKVLDIGCGYSPRGILFSEAGIDYVGADLPAVVRDMQKSVSGIVSASGGHVPRYVSADATDPNALLSAADKLEGPVCIIAEGLLMYFPIYELNEFLKGVKRILEVHGGCVVTPDFAMNKLLKVSASGSAGKLIGSALQKGAAAIVKEYTFPTNDEMDASAWYACESDEKPFDFFSEKGFKIERVPVLPEGVEIGSLAVLGERSADKLAEECRGIYGWVMTL